LRKVLSDGNFGARFDLIVLAGYMRILPADIAESYNMLNIHPSVLPFVYKGSEDGYADALANRDKIVGCTVHMVTKDVDAGPRLYQVGFGMPDEIIANENLDLLRQIGLAHEHALYPLVVRNIVFNMDQMISMPAVRGAALDNLRARCLPPVKTVFPENGAVFEYWNPATGKSR
jgi:folate-dependent phosphoribosylglycinamide formyltransferase PurN